MSININKPLLPRLCSLYLFGQPNLPKAEKSFDIKEFYDSDELNELEIDTNEPKANSTNPLFNLNLDWDTFAGSLRNSGIGTLDAFFSSIGSNIAKNLGFKTKLAVTFGTFLTSILGSKVKIPFISDKISVFNYAGRLVRSPLHIFDSIFSVVGESWSESTLGNFVTLASSFLGLRNSIKNPNIESNDLDYQTINGTLGRSSLHHLESMTSSFAQRIYQTSSLLGTALTLGITGAFLKLPDEIKKHNLSWKSVNGVLAQNLFHFLDSLHAGLGSLISNRLIKSKFLGILAGLGIFALPFSKNLENLLSHKLIFTEINAKTVRSVLHIFDTIVFNLGTEFAKSNLALPFVALYSLISYNSSILKNNNLPKIPEFKIPMNTVGGLLQRLPFDFVESVISATSNRVGNYIPTALLAVLGPALSFKVGDLFKDTKTSFNSSTGLVLKHSIHFWDNLLTKAGYNAGQALMGVLLPKSKKEYSGSLLSDGRWLTKDGRIVPRMPLAKQLAAV